MNIISIYQDKKSKEFFLEEGIDPVISDGISDTTNYIESFEVSGNELDDKKSILFAILHDNSSKETHFIDFIQNKIKLTESLYEKLQKGEYNGY